MHAHVDFSLPVTMDMPTMWLTQRATRMNSYELPKHQSTQRLSN